MQCCRRGLRQLCIWKMFRSMLAAYAILVLCNNVVPEAPSNIAPEKIQAIQAMSFEQRLVTLFTYVYIRSFTSKKNIAKVMLSLLWKSAETKAETAARYSTQQPVKSLVGRYLKKVKLSVSHAMLPMVVLSYHAILSHGFRKVSGPRLLKPLTLNWLAINAIG